MFLSKNAYLLGLEKLTVASANEVINKNNILSLYGSFACWPDNTFIRACDLATSKTNYGNIFANVWSAAQEVTDNHYASYKKIMGYDPTGRYEDYCIPCTEFSGKVDHPFGFRVKNSGCTGGTCLNHFWLNWGNPPSDIDIEHLAYLLDVGFPFKLLRLENDLLAPEILIKHPILSNDNAGTFEYNKTIYELTVPS